MSWMAKLYETYEQALKLDDNATLLPISHTLQNAHINISIDGEGNFIGASVLEKIQIILPATESSAGRSSGGAPHPLADKLQYVAKDYIKYGGNKKSYFDDFEIQSKKDADYINSANKKPMKKGYLATLKKWCDSPFAHPKAQAVLRYIEKGCVVQDLIDSKIVHVDEYNVLLSGWSGTEESPKLFKVLTKTKGEIEQGDALISWSVAIPGDPNSETWTDKSLQKSWIDYDASQRVQEGFCFVANQIARLAINHPARLRHPGDKAKLISSNDNSGFTYRGRFSTDSQACGVSFEVTQKVHNALRWLISRQGYRNGDQVIIAWAISGKELPSPVEDRWKPIEDESENIVAQVITENTLKIDHGKNMGQVFAEKLNKKLAGYKQNLGDHDTIIVMIIDSAISDKGRMAIAYYQEFNKDDFFNRLESWHTDFAWPQQVIIKKKLTEILLNCAPTPLLIAEVAYGEKVGDKLKKNTIERLVPCIMEEMPIPRDLVESCVRNVSNPQAYKSDEKSRWNRNISVACALYKGYCSDRNPNVNERRKYDMSLDREYDGRDYLYGRLLAVAERIERRALDDNGKGRITNAEGLMQRFSQHPFRTWTTIHDHLAPYRNRLRVSQPKTLRYWESQLKEIFSLFGDGEVGRNKFHNDDPLNGEYLLGYYCQKNYKPPKKTDKGKSIQPDGTKELVNEEEK